MKFLYIAKHGSGGNDDEGAIAACLQELGHEVVLANEDIRFTDTIADVVLFHHWRQCEVLNSIQGLQPFKAFWCFDLIDWRGDSTLARRCEERRAWVKKATEVCDVGFLTDGDWVARDHGRKLHWLPQGFDTRIDVIAAKKELDIVFTGIENGGEERRSFVREMRERYGTRFTHVPKGCYGTSLSELLARARIVVAPDAPITDRYWSNRVYNTLGRGAFLLHPYTEGLCRQYGPAELAMYQDRADLHSKIEYFLQPENQSTAIAYTVLGQSRTLQHHTYMHRVLELVSVLEERMSR